MDDYILVKSRQTELAEIETEDDGTVSLESLRCHLGQRIVSLKYQNEKTGLDRYLWVTEDRFQPPRDGWEAGRTTGKFTKSTRIGICYTKLSPRMYFTSFKFPTVIQR